MIDTSTEEPVSGGLLEAVLEVTDAAILLLDGAGRVRFANRSAARVLGEEVERLVGRPLPDGLELTAFDPGPCSRHARYRRPDGGEVDLECTAQPLPLDAGCPGSVLTLRDVTERNRVDRVNRAQICALLTTLRGLEHSASLDEYLRTVLTALASQLQEPSASLWLLDDASGELRLYLDYDDGLVTGATERRQPCGALSIPGETFLLEPARVPVTYDVETSPQMAKYRENLRRRGIRSIMVVPMLLGDRAIGTFHIRSTRRREFAPEEIELARALSRQATLALQLTRLAEQARTVAVAGERERVAQERADDLARANAALQAEVVERRRVEETLRRGEDLVRRSLSILATEPPLDTFLGHVLTAVTEQLAGPASTLWFYSPEENVFRIHMSYGGDRVRMGQLRTRGLPGPTRLDGNRADLRQLRRTLEPVVLNDVMEQPQLEPHRAWLQSMGVQAVLLVPLAVGESLIGLIAVHSRERDYWREDETAVARALAGQASLAIQLTRLADQARRAAVVEERNRMAQEIHDTLAQGFTGILIQLEAAQDALEHSPDEAHAHLVTARELARESLTEARRSVHALRPLVLETADLPEALKRLVERLGAGEGCSVLFETCGEQYPLNPDVAHDLLRACQEALANALRHAEATQVRVTLEYTAEGVRLGIADNGKGFDPADPRVIREGLGLTGLRERAARLRGELQLRSRPGEGTTVTLTVPGGDA